MADGFEEIEALTVLDVLRRAEVETVLVSINEDVFVIGAHELNITADTIITDVDFSEFDMIVLPGGIPGATNLNDCTILKEALVKFNKEGKYIAAICAAPLVFGGLGLLKGKKATCYPGFEENLIGAEYTANKVEVVDNIITGSGPGTAINFAYTLAEKLTSTQTIDDVFKGMLLK